MWFRHHRLVQVGVVDVGANTVRLQLAGGGETLHRAKAMLKLGESIERTGSIPESKLDETADVVANFAADARRRGVDRLEVLVTSPGRQAANGDELAKRLRDAARAPVRMLSAEEEARLGFLGAVSSNNSSGRKLVAVCDVGGGSAQIAVGTRHEGAAWARSLDIGSLRLTSRMLTGDPPGDAALEAAREEVARYLDGVIPPLPEIAFAIGGSARALKTIVGSTLGFEQFTDAETILARASAADVADAYNLDVNRVRTLAAGAIILDAIRDRLGVPLRVVRGGVREGALIELGSRRAAA